TTIQEHINQCSNKVWLKIMKLLNWKNIIGLLLLALILGVSLYAYLTYQHIEKSKAAGFDKVEDIVLSETDVDTIEEMNRFQEEAIFIAKGKDAEGKTWFVFVPQDYEDSDDLLKYETTDLVSPSSIEDHWASECDQCELKKSSAAMMDDEPLWELTYLDADNRYVLAYFSFEDGSEVEKLKLQNK